MRHNVPDYCNGPQRPQGAKRSPFNSSRSDTKGEIYTSVFFGFTRDVQMYIWSIASPLLKEQHTAALYGSFENCLPHSCRDRLQTAEPQSQNWNDKSTADNASSRESEERINVSLATDLTKGWMSVKLQLLWSCASTGWTEQLKPSAGLSILINLIYGNLYS